MISEQLCAICRKAIGSDDYMIGLQASRGDMRSRVFFCEPCLADLFLRLALKPSGEAFCCSDSSAA